MSEKGKLPFERKNYMIMISGIATIFLGLIIMSLDTQPYGFGFLGITLGPIVLLLGFAIEFLAIFHKPKKSDQS